MRQNYLSTGLRRAAAMLLLSGAMLGGMAGCASQEMPLSKLDADDRRMVEGYSLLYELVSSEQDLDGIFMLKSASEPTTQIIKDIASTSAMASRRLEQWNKANPAYGIRQPNLPAVEADARAKIEDLTTYNLLSAGADFELRLLLTQVDATTYGAALATVLAESDSNVERAKFCRELAERFTEFNARVRGRLTLLPVPKPE